MRKTKFLIIIIIIIGIIAIVYFGFLKKEKKEYSLVKVARGNIVQEVSETGTVKMGEEINISFKNTGRIEKIYIQVGDKVKSGQPLVELEANQLFIQLTEAQADLAVAEAEFNKLLAGATIEEIRLAETTVANAQASLESAKQNLEDVKTDAEEDLDNAYEDALNTLDDAYVKASTALETVKSIQLTYFTTTDQTSLRVKEDRDKIESSTKQIKFYLDIAKNYDLDRSDYIDKNIDLALAETKKALNEILQALTTIREACENPLYRDVVSSTNKTSLDTQKSNINTALTNVTNAQQTISSTKITNNSNINTAQAEIVEAEGALKKAQDELSKVKAPPRQEDIDLYQAKIKQAQAQVNLLRDQIADATIISSTEGQITKINKRVGETVQSTESVISLIPASPFQIEAEIYEEDIVKVKVGDPVDIEITALPDKILKGKVISIEPAEKIIEEVVYYKVTIDFQESVPQEIKPGMSTDITIKTASKENVLKLPKNAIEKKNGKAVVEVFKNGKIEPREIEIGVEGSDGMVEVVAGLAEGEEVIIK